MNITLTKLLMKSLSHTTLRNIIKRAPDVALSLLVILDRSALHYSPELTHNEAALLECGAYFALDPIQIEQTNPGDLIVDHLEEIGVLAGAEAPHSRLHSNRPPGRHVRPPHLQGPPAAGVAGETASLHQHVGAEQWSGWENVSGRLLDSGLGSAPRPRRREPPCPFARV